MSFYALNRSVLKLTLISVLTLAVGLGFQNCSTQFSSGSPEAQASLNTPNRVSDDSEGTDPSLDASELKIELYATAALQEDCSVSGENYQFEILNVSQDITMCMEYALDMPEGHPRRQESYKCNDINSQDKYVPPSSGWEYSATERKWSYRALANTVEQMPGDYRLYVRSGSSAAKSALLKVRRSGYANCGSQTAKYAVPEPVTPPSSGGAMVPTPAPPSPSPEPVVPGANGACNPAGTTLVEIDTGSPDVAYPRTNFRPTPSAVYAFAFKTKANGEFYTGRFTVNKLSSSITGKLIVISRCRGDVSRVLNEEKTLGCQMFGSETATLGYVVNTKSVYKPNYYCNLKPNTQYYLNVIGRDTAESVNLCENTSVCGFDFEKQ